MMRRKFFEAASSDTAAQRRAIMPLCQCLTRHVRSRSAEWLLSMRFVVPRQRRNEDGKPKRLIVNSSVRLSRKEAAALGHSRCSQEAYCSILVVPSLASSFQAALSVDRA
jgi:hypothetical protein